MEHGKESPAPCRPETVAIPFDIAVSADSLLSWIWHRHVPHDVRFREQPEYDRIIAGLRGAYESAAKDAGVKLTS